MKAPDPVRSPKLSMLWRCQYCGGRPRGNTSCCSFCLSFRRQKRIQVAFKKQNQGSGGDFYATSKKRISLRFANFVNIAVKDNKLLYRDAYKLLNLKGDTY